jgi:glycosyltransferase involved in cell wall biosynthesis
MSLRKKHANNTNLMSVLPGNPTQGMQNRLSFLFLLNSLRIGGSERKTVMVANELYARGHDVHVAYLNEPQALRSELRQEIPCVYLHRAGKFSLKALWLLRSYIRKFDPQNILCVNLYPMLYGLLAMTTARSQGRRCFVFINTTEFHSVRAASQMIFYAPILRCVSKVIFGCKAQQELWQRKYWLPPASCSYIYNGVDTNWFSQKTPLPQQTNLRMLHNFAKHDVVIGIVGQLRPEKNYPELLAACRHLLDEGLPIRGLIVGGGPEHDKLQAMVRDKGLEHHVVLLGQVKDVRPALLAMDIFVLTSSSVETFSNAALEAMSMEKPVVLSNIGGAAEMVVEGMNGCLYPSGDIAKLVTVLRRLVADEAIRQMMGKMARAVVSERFSLARMTDAYENIVT